MFIPFYPQGEGILLKKGKKRLLQDRYAVMDSYITVEKAAHTEIVIQKSRFLGFSIPCEKEEEALAFLSS